MKVRLDPKDEYMHELEEAENFNESMYFNVYDPSPEVGAWFRVGNRANEGYAEVTTCIYLPDGSIAFMFQRPKITNNDAFDAGGVRFNVVEPFKELTVSYEGKAILLKDPLVMKDPQRAFTDSPQLECNVELIYRGLSPMLGGEPEAEGGEQLPQEDFARGHYEQHVGARGRIAVGEDEWAIDGFGLRDHSWGPRYWQAPWWYRWLTANSGEDSGFMVSIVARRDGGARRGGVIFANGAYTPITGAKIETEWVSDDKYHNQIRCIATTPEREVEISGRVLSLIPLRNRRAEQMTRISEGLTEWHWEGKTGYGLSEYLDQIVEGRPVGD